mgnify:CR=1 FL=1
MAVMYFKPPEFTGENVPVTVAAEVMGKDQQFIRLALIRGLLPIGIAMKIDESNNRYNYYISPKLFWEYTGYIYEKALKKAQSPSKVESAQALD